MNESEYKANKLNKKIGIIQRNRKLLIEKLNKEHGDRIWNENDIKEAGKLLRENLILANRRNKRKK